CGSCRWRERRCPCSWSALECGPEGGLSESRWLGSRILTRGPRSSEILDATRGQRGPAGLVARAQAASVVAVEVLVEEHEILPVWILGEAPFAAVTRPRAVRVGQ